MESGSFEHRFGGIQRLYGVGETEVLRNSHVLIVGVGGVGSWAVEALARSGIGRITLLDWDDICLTNVNRQLPAMSNTVGRGKVDIMAERIALINPECQVEALREFFTIDNADEILSTKYDFVLDCIDGLTNKCILINKCRRLKMPLVVSGGCGGRSDPTLIKTDDLSRSFGDSLLAAVRKKLRMEFNFPRNLKRRFGIGCVYTSELPSYPQPDGCVSTEKPKESNLKLDCFSGFGAATFITGTIGFGMAAYTVRKLIEKSKKTD